MNPSSILSGIADLLTNERGIFTLALVVASMVFVLTGRMTIDQWTAYSQVVFVAYIGGHTVTSAFESRKLAPQPAPSSAPAPTPPANSPPPAA